MRLHYSGARGICTEFEVIFLREFSIALHSFADVQDFVSLATVQPFRVIISNDRQRANAKSFMGMFSIDYRRPVTVSVDCGETEYLRFRAAAARFLAE